MKNDIKKISKNIKLVITDVDGVLTDGGMYYSNSGESFKKFNARDGMGVEMLLNHGIKTVFITRENSRITKQRGKKVNAAKVILGIKNKETELEKICKNFRVKPENVAYIGDDINDIKIMKKVGFSATPYNGVLEVQKISSYICKSKGGEGAFREFAELILNSQIY